MSLQTLLADASKEGCPNVEKVKKILSQYPQLNSIAESHASQYISAFKNISSNKVENTKPKTESFEDVFGDKKSDISGKRIPVTNIESEGQQSLFDSLQTNKVITKKPVNILGKTLNIPNISSHNGTWSTGLTTATKGFVTLKTGNDLNNTISSQQLEREMVHYKGEGDGTLSVPKKTITPLEGKFPLTLYSPPEEDIPKVLSTSVESVVSNKNVPTDFRKLIPNTVDLDFPAKPIAESITPKYSLCNNKFSLSPTCNSKDLGKDSKSIVKTDVSSDMIGKSSKFNPTFKNSSVSLSSDELKQVQDAYHSGDPSKSFYNANKKIGTIQIDKAFDKLTEGLTDSQKKEVEKLLNKDGYEAAERRAEILRKGNVTPVVPEPPKEVKKQTVPKKTGKGTSSTSTKKKGSKSSKKQTTQTIPESKVLSTEEILKQANAEWDKKFKQRLVDEEKAFQAQLDVEFGPKKPTNPVPPKTEAEYAKDVEDLLKQHQTTYTKPNNPVTQTNTQSNIKVSSNTNPINHVTSTATNIPKYSFVSNSAPPHKVTSTFTPSTSTTTPVKPITTGSPNRPTTPIKRTGSLKDSLKGMGIYVLDVETTGLNLDDKMYSASFSKSKGGLGGTKQINVDEHFNIKESWANPKNYRDKKTGLYIGRDKHIDAVEKQLAEAHSSKKFGEEQLHRGSLRETAEAIVDGKTKTPTDFLQKLDKFLSKDKQGSVIFGHNTNFEDDVFNRYDQDGTKPYKDIFSTLENRNISNSSGIMSVDDTISNKTRIEDHKGSRQRANKYYHEHLKHSIRSGNTSLIDSGLKEYASKQMDVIDDIFKSINKARATPGAYAVVDSMDLARAAMSFGALNGDVDIGNLRLGASIDTMARAWYGEEEKHTAKDDVKLQRKVTNDLLAEIDEYRKDSNYRSAKIAQLNAFINKEDEATKTFQKSVISQFNRMIKSRDDTKGFANFEKFLTNMTKDYDIASGNHNDRLAFLNKFNQTRNALLSDESISMSKVKDSLETIMSKPGDIDTPSAKANKVASEGFDLLEHVKSHKGKYGIGAAVVAGTLLLGGGEEGKNDKYNTYDELYNGMYYGTPFADWQERNNAHKILY